MDLNIRLMRDSDASALADVYALAGSEIGVKSQEGEGRVAEFKRVTEGELILVAERGDEIVGFASIWEPDSFLHHLFVHPTFQRQGIGGSLLAACDGYFQSAPSLKCLKSNTRALDFYKSQGWIIESDGEDETGTYFVLSKLNAQCFLASAGPPVE